MKCIVVEDRFGDRHAARLGDGEDLEGAARLIAADLGFDDGETIRVFTSESDDPGWARLDAGALFQIEVTL